MLNKFFDKNEIGEFKEIANLFKKNRNLIINNWIILHDSINVPKFKYLQKGIEILIDSFIINLINGDIENYLEENRQIGKLVICHDVPYDLFIDSFHDFESSYSEILSSYYNESFSQKISLIDRLHHKTISILAKEYFELRDKTIFAMVKLVESRDKETGFHLERTRDYCKILSKHLGMNREFINYIYETSPLHDIGKVGILDNILLKKEKLTVDEFEIMKTHTKIGGDTINSIIKELHLDSGSLIMARDIAYYHHEKYDDTGYNGLKGIEIPISARIFMIADIFDALISKRTYKTAFSFERAYEIIIEGDGRTMPTDFDPQVLSAFKDCRQDFLRIYEKYQD